MTLVHRVHTSASPARVWAMLSDPRCWPQVDLTLRRVRGAHGPVSTGQHLLGLSRLFAVRIPVDVVEAVPEKRLVLLVHTAPGVREFITHELTPTVRGGCDLRVSVVVEGLFARVAFVPLWLASGLTTRVIGARTDRDARRARRTDKQAS
jgi:uncharacterized protein YndB with AHSA1/START domain